MNYLADYFKPSGPKYFFRCPKQPKFLSLAKAAKLCQIIYPPSKNSPESATWRSCLSSKTIFPSMLFNLDFLWLFRFRRNYQAAISWNVYEAKTFRKEMSQCLRNAITLATWLEKLDIWSSNGRQQVRYPFIWWILTKNFTAITLLHSTSGFS